MNTGPGAELELRGALVEDDAPVTSEGIRSGVNCTRENRVPVAVANDRAISVLASPG